jgi:adenylate kinase family enzyme
MGSMDMKRIAIVGATGSGKSTLGRALAARLGCPAVELDDLFWRPGWQQAPAEEFLRSVEQAAAGESWVIVGNYEAKARPLVWPRSDTVIWLDYSFPRTFRQLLRRCIARIADRRPICNGNRESLRLLFSKDSIMLWLFQSYWKKRRELSATAAGSAWPHIRFIRLKSPAETRAFLASQPQPPLYTGSHDRQ